MPVTPDTQVLIDEFEWTRSRHGGEIVIAAPILGVTAHSLERLFYRAVKDGAVISFKPAKRP